MRSWTVIGALGTALLGAVIARSPLQTLEVPPWKRRFFGSTPPQPASASKKRGGMVGHWPAVGT
jgi:hypothetical protein